MSSIPQGAREAPPYRLELELPGLPRGNTSALRRHRYVQARAARRLQELVVALVGRRVPPKPLRNARVTMIRRSSVEPDHEGLVVPFKAALDALCAVGRGPRARVIEDDRPSQCERVYRWERAPRGAGSLVIVVEEL